MQSLNFPYSPELLRNEGGRYSIFDVVRKKWLMLTPEEWVRQHLILYLHKDRGCPIALMAVEKSLKFNGMTRRSDLVIYSNSARAVLLAECKAPGIKITESVFDQAARYNMTLKVPFLMVTNGVTHFCCRIDIENSAFEYLDLIPSFAEMVQYDLGKK